MSFAPQFLVSVSKENSTASEVLDSLSQSVHVKPENLRLAEVCLSVPRLVSMYPDSTQSLGNGHWHLYVDT